MLQTTHKGLSGTALKTIALVLMLMDHIHYFFEFTGCIPEWFSMLARLSAPLFLFCTVEGFAHTHDRKRYFFRIWCIGAGMAAVQFFMIYAKAFRRGDGFYPQNAIFQDFVLLCVIWQGIDWVRAKKYGKGIAAIAAVVGWPYLLNLLVSGGGNTQHRLEGCSDLILRHLFGRILGHAAFHTSGGLYHHQVAFFNLQPLRVKIICFAGVLKPNAYHFCHNLSS